MPYDGQAAMTVAIKPSPKTQRPRQRDPQLPAAPYHLLWHQREVQAPRPGQYRITVPVIGGAPQPHSSRMLSEHLDRLWVGRPVPDGPAITSVVALLGEERERACLMLLLTVNPTPDAQRIDGARMARHLRWALQQLDG